MPKNKLTYGISLKGKNPHPGKNTALGGKDQIRGNKKQKWITVRSSNLWRISYNPETRLLSIIFVNKKSAVYNYKDVPGTIYLGLTNAVSKGEYHNEKIKNRFGFYIST